MTPQEAQACGLTSLAQPLLGRVGRATRTQPCVRASGHRPRAAVGVLVLALLLGACGSDRPRAPRHVFLITVDTLRSDHMSAYGYPRITSPRIQALAEDGVLFEHAVVQWPVTGASMASIFIGQYPQTTGITHKSAVKLPDAYLTLPELFQHGGFRTAAVVSNGVLSARLGWDAGFDEYLETWPEAGFPDESEAIRRLVCAGRVNELALPLLERHADAERLFVWLHYSDPHTPYILPEGFENPFLGDAYYQGDEMLDLEAVGKRNRIGDRRELKYYVAQYDANIAVVDRAIQEVIDRARALGLLDDALVVLTADHGESLGEHELYFGHGPLPYNTTSHVPFLFYYPGVFDRRRVAEPVELIDLYPTLRDLVAPGREIPGLEGDSLLPRLTGRSRASGATADDAAGKISEPSYAFSQAGTHGDGSRRTSHYRSVQDSRWKLVYHPSFARQKRLVPALYELYDLEQDPLETRNLAQQHPDELRRLRGELFAWMNGNWILSGRDYAEERSDEALNALRALGYIE